MSKTAVPKGVVPISSASDIVLEDPNALSFDDGVTTLPSGQRQRLSGTNLGLKLKATQPSTDVQKIEMHSELRLSSKY